MGTSKTDEGERAIRQAVPRSPRCCRCVARPAAGLTEERKFASCQKHHPFIRTTTTLHLIAARPADDRSILGAQCSVLSAQCSLSTTACARCQIARPPAPAGCFLDWVNHGPPNPSTTPASRDLTPADTVHRSAVLRSIPSFVKLWSQLAPPAQSDSTSAPDPLFEAPAGRPSHFWPSPRLDCGGLWSESRSSSSFLRTPFVQNSDGLAARSA